MAQEDWGTLDPDTQGGTDLAGKLNLWVAAVLSSHRGNAEPSYVVAGLEWPKTVSGTVEERYVYDGAQSLLLYTINPTAHTILLPAANLPAASDATQGAVELLTNAEFLAGTDAARAATADNVAALWEKGADNTGGATITLGDGGSFDLVTSTTTITAFAFTVDKAGRSARIRFNTVRTLTHNATSLILPGGADIKTAAGDTCEIESLGSGNFRVNRYTPAAARPYFSVHKNGTDQALIAPNTDTKITWSTEVEDVGGYFASSRWTPPAGLVELKGQIAFTGGLVDQATFVVAIYKNGSIFKYGTQVQESGTGFISIQVNAFDRANGTTDYYEVFVQGQGAGNKTVGGNAVNTWFQGIWHGS